MSLLSRSPRRRLIKATAVAAASVAASFAAAATPALAASNVVVTNQTTPNSGVVLAANDGAQHLWTPDTNFGVCRVDRNADGSYTEDLASCLSVFGKGNIKPGQIAYDGHYLYVTDQAAKSNGVIKVAYDPASNGGKGGLSVLDRGLLAPTCGLGGNVPWGAAMGPDHNLYLSFKKNANIVRVKSPAAFSGNCGDVQVMGQSGDRKKSFGLAFAGTNLWETNNNGIGVIANAPSVLNGQAQSTEAFAIPAVQAITSDAQGTVYVGTANSVLAFDGVAGSTPATLATGFQFVSGLSVDGSTVTPGQPAGKLFVGDDPSNGTLNNQGRIWTLTTP
jgi:hypothetical protein